MQTRPATMADVGAITELQRRFDEHWFGAAERNQNEMREALAADVPLEHRSLLMLDGDRLLAACWFTGTDSNLVADPALDRATVHAAALAWFRSLGKDVECLGADAELCAALEAGGWQHHHSSFELQRRIEDGWRPAAPSWPDGIRVTELRPENVEAIHRLIYVDAGWAEVPGHPDRDLASWRSIFVTDQELPDQQVLAWRGNRLVGVAMGRIFSDGAGWIAQLAVAREERGRGLGRALLLESLRRRIDAGATLVGLGVSAANRTAVRLYEDAGLVIDREWRTFRRPA